MRYNCLIKVNLNGVTIVSSAASVEYDATLVCHDVSNMQQGLLPLTVQYASGKSVHFLTGAEHSAPTQVVPSVG